MRSVMSSRFAGLTQRRFATTFGGADTAAAVAAAVDVAPAALGEVNQVRATWAKVDVVARARLAPVVATVTAESLLQQRYALVAGTAKPVAFKGTLKAAIAPAATVAQAVGIFEAAMLPVRQMEQERFDVQLDIYYQQDTVNLGLAKCTPEVLKAAKKRLIVAGKELAANREAHKKYVTATFDTASCNDLVNVLRMATAFEWTNVMATRVMEDMTLANVPFSYETQLMLKNVVMGDGPHEDSGVLFTLVENPERGEVNLSQTTGGDLKGVSGDALKTISARHTTPLTEGAWLHQNDTHPMLQRSAE
jgi:hypothetical protein